MLCNKCLLDKDEKEFSYSKRNTQRNHLQSYCRSCMSQYRITWEPTHRANIKRSYEKNKNKPENKLKALLRVSHLDRSELDFDWAWAKLSSQSFCCELTGIPFTWGTKEATTLSIDRIDPTKGYTKDNVRFVCWWVNTAMGNWGLEKLKECLHTWRMNDSTAF